MSANTTALTPEQREAIYEAWIAALRSGQYKQGRFRLERDGRFCCLGVLCHVLHTRPELGIEMHRSATPGKGVVYSTQSAGCYARVPFSDETSELGLSVRMLGGSREVEDELVALNDDRQASFAEIAQFIEDAVMPLLRAKGLLPPAQQEALEGTITLEQAESHARICAKLAEEHKDDVLVCVALTDAAAIIRDLLRDRLGASATGAGQAEIEALRQALAALKAENEMLRKVLKEADNELDWLDGDMDTCDHSVGVCMCSYWSMRRKMKAALSKENSND